MGTLFSDPAAETLPNIYPREYMEELNHRQLSVKQLKRKFLEALQTNDAQEVLQILQNDGLDIDTVLEVKDPEMVLASYKQGTVT